MTSISTLAILSENVWNYKQNNIISNEKGHMW
jgi:hypothetical protein